MEISALIGSIALDATLERTRLKRIEATINSGESPVGGLLYTASAVDISGTTKSSGEHIATATIEVKGFSKGTRQEDVQTTKPIFSIAVTAQGAYRLTNPVPPELHRNQRFAYVMCRPIYALAASELRAIAVKMGLTGVKPAPDLPKPQDSPASDNMHSIKRIPAKKTAASIAPKVKRVVESAAPKSRKSSKVRSKE